MVVNQGMQQCLLHACCGAQPEWGLNSQHYFCASKTEQLYDEVVMTDDGEFSHRHCYHSSCIFSFKLTKATDSAPGISLCHPSSDKF